MPAAAYALLMLTLTAVIPISEYSVNLEISGHLIYCHIIVSFAEEGPQLTSPTCRIYVPGQGLVDIDSGRQIGGTNYTLNDFLMQIDFEKPQGSKEVSLGGVKAHIEWKLLASEDVRVLTPEGIFLLSVAAAAVVAGALYTILARRKYIIE